MYLALVGIAILNHQSNQLADWLPTEVRQRFQFEFVSERYRTGIICTLQRSGGAVLDVRIRAAKPELLSQKAGIGADALTPQARYRHGQTPSGLPIGTLSAWLPNNSVDFRVAGKYEALQAGLRGKTWRNGTSRGAETLDGLAESPMVEVISRYGLSAFAAQRLAPDGNVSVGSLSYPALKASGTNTRYIDLAVWAERNSLVVSIGQDGTVKSFNRAGQQWIIPLASVKIKRGSTWMTLPDLVMRRDGKFWIPVAALQ